MDTEKPVFKNRNLYIIFSITLVAMMGVASITPAFPDIIAYFGIVPQQVGWLITSFTLPGIFLVPFTGMLADRFGRKLVLVPALFIFGLAGFACMFAPSFKWLMLLRFFQGVGASSLSSLNLTLIGDLFAGPRRTSVMGYNAGVLSVGTATYPAVGGAIALFGWRYIFLLPLFAIPLGIWVLKGLKNPEPDNGQKIKAYFGRVWRSINQKHVWGLLSVNLILFLILYGSYLTYFPLMMKSRLGSGSSQIGLMMSLMSATTALTSFQLGKIGKKVPVKKLLLFGSSGYLVSLLLMSASGSYPMLAVSVMIFGLGHGVMIPSIQNLLVGFASMNERAAFMSVNSMVLYTGQTLGPVLVGLFFVLSGLHAAFLAGAFFSVCMLAIIFLVVNPPVHKFQVKQ